LDYKPNEMAENKRFIDAYFSDFLELMDQRYLMRDEKSSLFQAAPTEYISIKVCAELTGYKEGYIRQLVFKSQIPYYKTPNRKPIRFKRAEILHWMAGKKFTPIDERTDDYINSRKIK
jgi:excisionase family DNA binding protein